MNEKRWENNSFMIKINKYLATKAANDARDKAAEAQAEAIAIQ